MNGSGAPRQLRVAATQDVTVGEIQKAVLKAALKAGATPPEDVKIPGRAASESGPKERSTTFLLTFVTSDAAKKFRLATTEGLEVPALVDASIEQKAKLEAELKSVEKVEKEHAAVVAQVEAALEADDQEKRTVALRAARALLKSDGDAPEADASALQAALTELNAVLSSTRTRVSAIAADIAAIVPGKKTKSKLRCSVMIPAGGLTDTVTQATWRTIILRLLPAGTTEAALRAAMYAVDLVRVKFHQHAEGDRLGVAFLEYQEPRSAATAMQQLVARKMTVEINGESHVLSADFDRLTESGAKSADLDERRQRATDKLEAVLGKLKVAGVNDDLL